MIRQAHIDRTRALFAQLRALLNTGDVTGDGVSYQDMLKRRLDICSMRFQLPLTSCSVV